MSKTREFMLNLSNEQYQLWRHHPVSEAFLGYLAEQAQAYKGELVNRWISKTLKDKEMDEFRGIVMTLEELSNLPLEVIKQFYSYQQMTGLAEKDEAKIS